MALMIIAFILQRRCPRGGRRLNRVPPRQWWRQHIVVVVVHGFQVIDGYFLMLWTVQHDGLAKLITLECVWKQYYRKGTVQIPIIAAEEEEAARWSFRPIDYSYFTIGLSECDMNRPSSLWLLAFTNKTHFTVRAHHENDSWWASMSCLQYSRHIKVLSQRSFRPLSVSLPQWHVLCSTKLCTSTIPRYSSVSLS